jgi:tetratricopeptide (TPR) repeat protein/DNA-binding CsgD family transcriptional regulator
MVYQDNQLVLPQEIYSAHLETINAVKLSKREIDIIACVLNGRSAKGIGHFLSISPRTVEVHIHNAMKKLGCTSRESLVIFLEKTEQFLILKAYYLNLLTYNAFEKSLKDIEKQVVDTGAKVNCLIVYWQKNNSVFFQNLKSCLMLAGISVSLEMREQNQSLSQLAQETHQDIYTIYALPDSPEANLQPAPDNGKEEAPQSSHQTTISDKVLFLLPDAPKLKMIPFSHIHLAHQKNYYCLVFLILTKILPSLDLTKIVADFEGKHEMLPNFYGSAAPNQIHGEEKSLTKNDGSKVFRAKKLWPTKEKAILSFSLFLALSAPIGFFTYQYSNDRRVTMKIAQNQHSPQEGQESFITQPKPVQSDLVMPAAPLLLNRLKIIHQIEGHFKKHLEDIQTVALIGIGGSGKTTLARQYAHSQELPVIWEINAETQESLKSSFENLAYAILKTNKEKNALRELQGIKSATEREEKIMRLVKESLRSHSDWLLIYDNVEQFNDIQKYFPSDARTWGKGKVILTTQNSHMQNNNRIHLTIQVGGLEPSEKLDLFLKVMSRDSLSPFSVIETGQAKKFLNHIPPFPLDVSAAAYYLKATNIAYKEYLARLDNSNEAFLEMQKNILNGATEYTRTRYSIISLSLKDFIHKNKNFCDLLLLTSLLDSENIPRDLLNLYKGELIVDNFIYSLKKYSLIVGPLLQSAPTLSHIFIHRSTQNISFVYLAEFLKLNKDSSLLKEIVCLLDDYLGQAIEAEDFPKMQVMAGHLEKFLHHRNLLTDFSQGLLESKLGCIYYFIKNDKSHQAIENSIKILVRQNSKILFSDEDRSKIARSLLQVGVVCTELRLYKEAQELIEQAVKVYGKSGLRNNLELSWTLSHLGNVYRRMGNYEKARDYLEDSVRLSKQYETDGKRIVHTLSCLGSVYRGLGSYQKSIEILEESLKLCEKHYSKDHIRVGRVLKSLGTVYRRLGDYQKAKEYIERSVLIFKKHFPENHLNIGLTLAYLGNCLRELGEYQKSCNCLEQSLNIHRKHFDENHATIGWILFHLARTYKDLGRHQESQELFDKVLKIYDKKCEGESIETARLLRDMAEIYLEKNCLDEAESFTKTSLSILERRNHIDIYRSLETLGEIYLKKSIQLPTTKNSQNFKNQAIDQFNQALKIAGQYFPKNSAHIQRIHSRIKIIQEARL